MGDELVKESTMGRGQSTAILDQFRTLFGVGALGPLSDEQLLDCFGSGGGEASEPAFAALVERHGPMVLGVCRRVLGDDHLAEDAFQATFLVLARRSRTIRDRDALGPWLHRVARRVARRSKVRSDRGRRRERPEAGEVAVMSEDLAERNEIRAVVDDEVDRLADSYRLPIVLCDLEGLTHEQAAQRLRWPVGTVKSRLARGRARLGDRLRRRGLAPEGTPASVPASLVALTARAAVRFAAARSAASLAASSVTSLAEKELLAMTLARWTLAGSIAAVGALAASTAILIAKPAQPTAPAPAPPPTLAQAPVVQKPAPGPPVMILTASGRVVDQAGRPIAGATVFVREWSTWRTGWESDEQTAALMRGELIPDVLATTRTDADGRFRIEGVAAPAFPHRPEAGKSAFPWDVVVLAEGHGVVHEHLTAVNQKRPLTLTLPSERPVVGRIVEPGGKPIAGATVRVNGVGRIGEDDEHGQKTEGILNLAWSSVPLAASTDADGRFTLRGLPPEVQASLTFRAPGHAQDYCYYATTDRPPADLVDTTIRSGQTTHENVPVRVGNLTIELKPTDHSLVGRVVFEDGGKPAAGMQVFRGQAPVGKTDASGRFRIDELTAGSFELHVSAWETEAAPLAVRVEMPEAPRIVERTFQLPRGVAIAGRVTDEATGQGVEGVELSFDHQLARDEVWSFFGLSATTGKDGRYRLVVPAGRGRLNLVGTPPGYPPLPMRTVGESPEARFSRELEAVKGREFSADFTIPHGQRVVVRAIEGDGRPVEGAEVRLMKAFDFNKVAGRTDAGGKVELVGLDRSMQYTADITHPSKLIGARLIVPANPAGPTLEVQLKPLGSATSRVLDESGRPLEGASVMLYTDVEFPEQSGMPVGDVLADRDGKFSFDRLIEGVEYYVKIEADGHANATSKRLRVKPGAKADLAEFRVPETNQTLDGFVVDARGNRLPKISVGVQPDHSSGYTPSGKFFEETDGKGEFHLNGLPGGELVVMAYRRPEGADRSIKHSVKVKVQAGSKGVRIVLPDPNQRLRGIED
jgi:RNA polymerase sigma factor (sigma-70 family)